MSTYGTTFELHRVQHVPANVRFVDGRLQMVTEEEKVVQDICIILRTIFNEDMFHPSFGFDSPRIVDSSTNKRLVDFLIRKALAQYPFLERINSIEVGDVTSFREIPVKINLTTKKGSTIELGVTL